MVCTTRGLGGGLEQPLTVQVASLVQSNDEGGAAILAATCVAVPVLVGLQKYFVRGVLGGAVKG